MRDLKADLELCNKATLGPWEVFPPLCGPEGQTVYQVDSGGPICDVSDPYPRGDNKPQENMMFIAQAREGWPHAIERAIKAEKQLEELLAWEKPKEKCYLSAMRRIAELESLVRELVDALDFMLGDKSTRTDWLVEMGKTYSKAKEVLGDEV